MYESLLGLNPISSSTIILEIICVTEFGKTPDLQAQPRRSE